MTHETLQNTVEFEQKMHTEVERKFVPRDGSQFDEFKATAADIAQLYISSPEDEYSLRLRKKTVVNGETRYTATLKDRGIVQRDGLVRMEIETPISETAFNHYYNSENYAVLFKKRAEICDGVTVDWIEGSETPLVEVENPTMNLEASDFLVNFESDLIDRTGQSDVDNESLAYAISGHKVERVPAVSPRDILEDIVAYRQAGVRKLVIGIAGRSGSGKTTLAHELQAALATHPSFQESVALLSTDDYHVGKQYLEATYGAPWTNWEDARVYNTRELAQDIRRLQSGETIHARHFNFETEETVRGDMLAPTDIIIVEGIHAGSKDLAGVRQMFYEVSTPLSTSLGRDMKRLLATDRPNQSISSPEARLRYIVEIGEPTYQTIERAPRNQFTGCMRPLARAALLREVFSGWQPGNPKADWLLRNASANPRPSSASRTSS